MKERETLETLDRIASMVRAGTKTLAAGPLREQVFWANRLAYAAKSGSGERRPPRGNVSRPTEAAYTGSRKTREELRYATDQIAAAERKLVAALAKIERNLDHAYGALESVIGPINKPFEIAGGNKGLAPQEMAELELARGRRVERGEGFGG